MAVFDLRNNFDAVTTLAPAARTATINGTGVDLAPVLGSMVVFQAGTITDGTHTPSVQESADNVTFTGVAAADLEGPALVNITTNSIQRIGYKGVRQFIRGVVTVAGATTGGVYGAIVIRGAPRHAPLA